MEGDPPEIKGNETKKEKNREKNKNAGL